MMYFCNHNFTFQPYIYALHLSADIGLDVGMFKG